MKKILSLILLCICLKTIAQENEEMLKGTISVHKTGHISKVFFDDVNYRLLAIDEYGNMLDSAVLEFKVGFTVKGIFYEERVSGSTLSQRLQNVLGTGEKNTKLMFNNIRARDRTGTIIEIPKLKHMIGSFKENDN